MQFADVIGNRGTKNFLTESFSASRIPHAQLFLAPPGSGGLAMAAAFAQLLNCERPQADDSCGKCLSCIKAGKMVHPDIHFSFPVVKKKDDDALSNVFMKEFREAFAANPYMNLPEWISNIDKENKQGNLSAAECNEIIRVFNLKTFEGKYKILLMWLPEYLGKEGNRLLKLLEEPPQNSVFILVAENHAQILNTILSRTQLVKMRKLTDEEITDALVAQKGLDEKEALHFARLADGDFGQACRLLNQTEDHVEMLRQWVETATRFTPEKLMEWVETFSSNSREQMKSFLTYASGFARELILRQMSPFSRNRLNPAEEQIVKDFLSSSDVTAVAEWSELVDNLQRQIERNAHPKITITHHTIRMRDLLAARVAG